jgi:lon-related putative ATP-dependent protease
MREDRPSETRDRCRLTPAELRWRCDPDLFPFEITEELGECPISIIGQPRAMDALRLGFDLRNMGYNIFVAGDVGTGRSTAVRQVMAAMEKGKKAPEDLVYVHNFKNGDEPRLMAFPAGRGRAFRKAMKDLVSRVQRELPEVYESEAFRNQRAGLVQAAKEEQKKRLKEFEARIESEGFAMVQVQKGPLVIPGILPVVAGNPVDMDQLEKLTEENKFDRKEFERFKEKHKQLGVELSALSKDFRHVERDLRKSLEELDRQMAEPLIREAVEDVREEFSSVAVQEFLDQATEEFLSHVEGARELAESDPAGTDREMVRAMQRQAAIPYTVNLLVDNGDTHGRPVIWETSPTYRNLFGAIERAQDNSGQWQTDHTRIKAGSLIRANGGYLVVDALDLLAEQGTWPALKRALRTRETDIRSFDPLNIFAGVSLNPESVPLDVKVILIGTKQIYRLLYHLDEDFKKIFKVKAEFALQTPLSEDEMQNYACFVHKKCNDDSLPPFHRGAVAAVVEEGVRLAGRQEKLTTRFNAVADIIREAGYWAQQSKAKRVEAKHVDKALDERRRRVDLTEELLRERIAQGTYLLDLEGEKVGQVNGLAVLSLGDHSFGQASRITAVTAMGKAGIINIERESEMSGALHTKGILILSGFLRQRFAQNKPLALSASVCFEQSYGPIDGDSASSAELYALLSSLAEVPIRQGVAVTGSVNQRGEIQPIGGVNEKVEGYFDLCKLKGLTGKQGVMLPALNLPELMLRKDVVEAVKKKRFHIWSVSTVEEGLAILTDFDAGEPGKDGAYAPDTVFGRVDAKLDQLAQGIRAFGPDYSS